MPQTMEHDDQSERDVRETLIEVRAKLKLALHLAKDRAGRKGKHLRFRRK